MPDDNEREIPAARPLKPPRFICDRHDWSIPYLYTLIRNKRVRAYKQGRKTVVDVIDTDDFATATPLVLGDPQPTPASRGLAAKRAKDKLKSKSKAKTSTRRKADDGPRAAT
jgi:hypothetical protein